jgi:hypothetical protein
MFYPPAGLVRPIGNTPALELFAGSNSGAHFHAAQLALSSRGPECPTISSLILGQFSSGGSRAHAFKANVACEPA